MFSGARHGKSHENLEGVRAPSSHNSKLADGKNPGIHLGEQLEPDSITRPSKQSVSVELVELPGLKSITHAAGVATHGGQTRIVVVLVVITNTMDVLLEVTKVVEALLRRVLVVVTVGVVAEVFEKVESPMAVVVLVVLAVVLAVVFEKLALSLRARVSIVLEVLEVLV